MYWTDEDIQPSVDLAEKIFGKGDQSNVFLLPENSEKFGRAV